MNPFKFICRKIYSLTTWIIETRNVDSQPILLKKKIDWRFNVTINQ